MKNVRRIPPFVTLACLAVLSLVFISWQPGNKKLPQEQNPYAAAQDTSSPRSSGMDQTDIQLNLDSVMQQVNKALSSIDFGKISTDAQREIAKIDFDKIRTDVNSAIKKIDWDKMKMDVNHSLDSAKMAIDKINWDKMKADMYKAQADAKKALASQKINMDSIKIQIQQSMADAQKSFQSAKAAFANQKALKTALEKDGLIQEGKPYKVQLKEGILYINGAKQSKAITDKYRNFYLDKKNFTISDDGGVDL